MHSLPNRKMQYRLLLHFAVNYSWQSISHKVFCRWPGVAQCHGTAGDAAGVLSSLPRNGATPSHLQKERIGDWPPSAHHALKAEARPANLRCADMLRCRARFGVSQKATRAAFSMSAWRLKQGAMRKSFCCARIFCIYRSQCCQIRWQPSPAPSLRIRKSNFKKARFLAP